MGIATLEDSLAIAIVFRGSEDVKNWLSDLDLRRSAYDRPGCNDCLVHDGFLAAEATIITSVLNETARLMGSYGATKVLVTGHSLGAAIATLVAVDLKLSGVAESVELMNFGCPRVFNAAGAVYASSLLGNASRFTHNRDIVVHVPLTSQGYQHILREWYEEGGVLHNCPAVPEDKDCADKWAIEFTSFTDHMHYLNITMICIE